MSDVSDGAYAAFQSGLALMAAAMRGAAERVPVLAQLHEFAAGYLGIPRQDFFRRPEVMVPAILEVEQQFGVDVASISYDVYNIESEALGQRIRWSDTGMPDIDRDAPLIRDRDDLPRLRTPDFDAQPACQRVLAMHALFRRLTGIEPGLSFCAPFTLATNLRGIEQFLVDICTEPDFARDLLTRITDEVLGPWITYQAGHFPNTPEDLRCGCDRLAADRQPAAAAGLGGPPDPAAARAMRPGGSPWRTGSGSGTWSSPQDMLDLKLQVGPGSLLGQDPDVEALGPDYYKAYADRRNVPLILGVGAAFLAQARPAAVAERVRRYAEIGARGGRFALYLCNLAANTPPGTSQAAVDAAHAVRPDRCRTRRRRTT